MQNTWNAILKRARMRSIKLEALLRGCKPIVLSEEKSLLLCDHEFHRVELQNFSDDLTWAFKAPPDIHSTKEYLEIVATDPLVLEATQNLGAVVAV